MRIIIVQAEIELAIRNYILTQIAVKEGQDITIDFKNTRGDDGATAEINIAPHVEGNVQRSTQGGVQQLRSIPTTKIAPNMSTASAAPAVAATAAIPSEPDTFAEAVSTTSEPEGPNQKEEIFKPIKETIPFDRGREDTSEDPVQKPKALDAPVIASKSLFATLTKPVNPKPDPEA